MNIKGLPTVALIAGPTASGKSALALALAEKHRGTVINADSMQVYADLRILTARPPAEDERRIPHRLFGHIDAAEPYSAARWAAEAYAAIREVHGEGGLPILVGGTGMYLRTLLDGIAPVPEIDPEVRRAVRALAVADAHSALAEADPEGAARLGSSDTSRVARALEVVRSTGTPIGEWQSRRVGGIADQVALVPLVLLPPRAQLYARCDARFKTMASPEGVAEVADLLKRQLDSALPVMRAIGVRELAAFIRGEATQEEAVRTGQTATRQYAKRQYTWFARQSPAHWPRHGQAADCEGMANALAGLHARLPG